MSERLERGPSAIATRLGGARRVGRRVATPVLDALLRAATHPAGTRATHAALSAVGNLQLAILFRREPLARTLFDLAEWAAERADRGPVVAALMRDALQPDGAFYHLVRLEIAQAHAGCVGTLCQIVALGAGVDGPLQPSRAWLEQQLPHRFGGLLPPLFGTESPATTGAARAMARRVRSPFPAGSRFLFGPYLTFLNAYLARNLVDALPRVGELIREAAVTTGSIPGEQAVRMRARSLEEK